MNFEQHVMVVGTTEPQDFLLVNDGAAMDLTGLTPTIEWRGTAPAGTFAVEVLAPQSDLSIRGKVRVTGTGSMVAGSYPARFKLTDGASRVGYVPNLDGAIVWRVVPV